ncbi:MAG TPA: 2Fe-2S iron-sulfur cluster-binding protein, partial [Edaphobacter sp.]|nr:2Fe-2S iron-sulfur cluster-binding protein [Edaphobacter sp.]
MAVPRPLLNTPRHRTPDTEITLDGVSMPARAGDLLIDLINDHRSDKKEKPLPQVCYLPQMGPIESCDTCMVQVNGQLVRACGTQITAGMNVVTAGAAVDIAQREAFDRILQNHDLYCTVCDNNNQNCTVHNTTAVLDVKHQARPFTHKPYPQDHSNAFYRYDPDQCILCGRCVEACQNVQV